jgi:hypothetical protein
MFDSDRFAPLHTAQGHTQKGFVAMGTVHACNVHNRLVRGAFRRGRTAIDVGGNDKNELMQR